MIERRKRKRRIILDDVAILTRSQQDRANELLSQLGKSFEPKPRSSPKILDLYIVQCLRYDQPNYLDWISCHSIKEARRQTRLCKKLPYHEQSKFRIVHRIEELVK